VQTLAQASPGNRRTTTTTKKTMTVSIEREHAPGDRYRYDHGLPADFAQLDTSEDASYFGNWASAQRRVLFSYCEGDCCTTVCTTDEEFKAEIQKFTDFCDRIGYKFLGVDPGLQPDAKEPWEAMGLAHLLH